MQVTTHTDYALRLLIYLSVQPDRKGTIQEAAQKFAISANHLAKVAQTLVQHNYIISYRGRGGGLALGQPTEDIIVGTLVRQTENLHLLPCFQSEVACTINSACILKSAFGRAQQAFLNVLDEYTLADLVKNKQQLQGMLNVA